MTNFEYKKIDLEEPTFRLLRLLKGDDELIQCRLSESSLVSPESHGSYAAVSYTWGSKSKPCRIIVNGSEMAVTKNAYLSPLRDLRYQGKGPDSFGLTQFV